MWEKERKENKQTIKEFSGRARASATSDPEVQEHAFIPPSGKPHWFPSDKPSAPNGGGV